MFDKLLGRDMVKKSLTIHKELLWAQVYHDSIRGYPWLQNLSLNIGRWAGSYAFFYVLHRVLTDSRPSRILELGLGESSKFIAAHIVNSSKDSEHIAIEHDNTWIEHFRSRSPIAESMNIHHLPLEVIDVDEHKTKVYGGLQEFIQGPFDLYVVDGPKGAEYYSRYDMVHLSANFSESDDFVIIFDDYNRPGERQTVLRLLRNFKQKGISVSMGVYSGTKSVAVIGTKKYKYVSRL